MSSSSFFSGVSNTENSQKVIEIDSTLFRRLMSAIEQLADVIVITDTDGVVVYVNSAYEKVGGFKAEEAIGKKCGLFAENGLEEADSNRMWQMITAGDVWKGNLVTRHKEGHIIEEEVTISPLRNSRGEIVNYFAVMRDVTQQREMEKQLRQAQKLESIGQLAAGIAHEINTPIQYVGDNTRFLKTAFDDILGLVTSLKVKIQSLPDGQREIVSEWFSELSEEADLDYLVEEVPSAVDQSLEGVERVASIVRAMKEFSHPGGDEKVLIDLNSAISNTITVARNEWKYVADLMTDFEPDLPQLPCLPGELNQVWLNLIVNAAHAIEQKNKELHTEAKGAIEIHTRRDENHVVVTISDTGCGIPKEIIDKIFDPFFTTKSVGKGTGQGLAIAHSVIVDKHNGEIDVSSVPNEGTMFTIRLPLFDGSTSLDGNEHV